MTKAVSIWVICFIRVVVLWFTFSLILRPMAQFDPPPRFQVLSLPFSLALRLFVCLSVRIISQSVALFYEQFVLNG